MSPRNDGSVPWPVRLLLIGSAVSAIVAAIVGFAGAAEKREPGAFSCPHRAHRIPLTSGA